MIQATPQTRCSFREGGFACTLQADHEGAHFGQYVPVPAKDADALPAPFQAVFGDVLEGKSPESMFYGLGDDEQPSITADSLDKALAFVRLSEKWDERAAHDLLLPELDRSTFFKSVVSDYVRGLRDAGKDLSGRSYYTGQLCLRLLAAGYFIGFWQGAGK